MSIINDGAYGGGGGSMVARGYGKLWLCSGVEPAKCALRARPRTGGAPHAAV